MGGEELEREIHSVVVEWLQRDEWSKEEVTSLLEGKLLPSLLEDFDEPYLRIYRNFSAFPIGEDSSSRLAERLASALSTDSFGSLSERSSYNLLMLSSCLRDGDHFLEPLYLLYQHKLVHGNWRGADLKDALRSAITTNQIDQRMRGVWSLMLDGQPDEYLPGDVLDGYNGVLYMPSSSGNRSAPDGELLIFALHKVASYFIKVDAGRHMFQRLLSQINALYPSGSLWKQFSEQISHTAWPEWTREDVAQALQSKK